MLVQHFLVHFQDCLHVTLLPLLPSACFCSLDSCSCPCYLHKSALLAAVLMTALVHCSHILRHVLLQKSSVLAAVPLRCSCDRLWSPFLFFFFFLYKQSSWNVLTCASMSTNIDNDNPCTECKAAPAVRSVAGLQAHTQLGFCGVYALTQRCNSSTTMGIMLVAECS